MLFRLKQLISRFHVVALALLFAVTVAGCGGGSSTSTADMDGDGMKTPEPVAAAQGRAATAATAAQDAADKAGMLDPIDDATQAELDKANAAAGAAVAAKTIADGTDNVGTAEAAAKLAETEQGKAETAYENAMTASEKMRQMMAVTAAALTKEKAIGVEAMNGTGGLGGETDTDLAIAHKDGAVSIVVSRGAGDDKKEFESRMDLTGPNGFEGTMNVSGPNDDGETEIAIVYTDIDAPKATPFAKVKDEDGVETQVLNRAKDGTVPVDPADSVALAITTGETGNAGMVVSDSFTASSAGTLMLEADDASTTDVDEGAYAGTFNGAMGTYKCNGDDGCGVVLNAKGMVTGVSGNWVFIPAKGAMSNVPDYDYLHYGVWLMKTDDEKGTTYNEVQTFAGSRVDMSDGSELNSVEGSAEYKGGAAGVYVHEVNPSGGPTPESATSGHFSADVNLMVYFGGPDVAENMKNRVTEASRTSCCPLQKRRLAGE